MPPQRRLAALTLAALLFKLAPLCALGAADERGARDLLIVAGGDVAYPDNWIEQDFQERGAKLFEHVAPWVEQADLAFVNLESPLTRSPIQLDKRYPIRTAPERLQWILKAGFNLISLANNHTFDAGRKGILDTLGLLEAEAATGRRLWWAGAAREVEGAYRPTIFQVPGKELRVAFLAFGPAGTPLVPHHHSPRAARAIGEAARQADLVIVSAHTGREYRHVPSAGKAALFRSFIKAGAHIVLGHHPHVIQGVEPFGDGLILHSLGNFSFASKTVRHRSTGAKLYGMLPIIEVRDGRVAGAEIVPLYVNNREPWRIGSQTLKPDPCVPQVLRGAFAARALADLQSWTRKIPGISPRAASALRIEGERAIVSIPSKTPAVER